MKTQIAAIEFGTSKIVTVVAKSSGISKIDIVGSGTVPYEGFSDGAWNEPDSVFDAVRDSISAAELEANTKIEEIYIGVPGEFIRVVNGEAEYVMPETDKISDEEIDRVQDLVAEKLHIGESGEFVLHRSPAWYSVNDGKKTM